MCKQRSLHRRDVNMHKALCKCIKVVLIDFTDACRSGHEQNFVHWDWRESGVINLMWLKWSEHHEAIFYIQNLADWCETEIFRSHNMISLHTESTWSLHFATTWWRKSPTIGHEKETAPLMELQKSTPHGTPYKTRKKPLSATIT